MVRLKNAICCGKEYCFLSNESFREAIETFNPFTVQHERNSGKSSNIIIIICRLNCKRWLQKLKTRTHIFVFDATSINNYFLYPLLGILRRFITSP